MVRFAIIEGGYLGNTEQFLLKLPGISDAQVYMERDVLTAHVIQFEDSNWDERSLKVACVRELGLAATPGTIIIRDALRHVA